MPLTNRAPVNAAGQIMVTGTTPTPAWPVLGGMTYDPVTGELAVTSAVPNATDPWVGGLRFTNLGALYIVTTIPSPVFYVGGLPVSTLGQLFMSANPPVGSVGGWPIAGDGGVAGIGSGIGPVPIFWAPLLTTLVPTIAGNPAFTFTRATTAYVADNENILRQAVLGEARFQGARRVRNYITGSTVDLTGGTWGKNLVSVAFLVTGPTGLADASTVTSTGAGAYIYQGISAPVGVVAVNSLWIRRRTGTGIINLKLPDNGLLNIAPVLTSAWQRIACSPTVGASPVTGLEFGTVGDAVDVTYFQYETVAGQSNQAPGEYVSVGVLSAPYHGCGIDGIRCFLTTNGNSVAGNIVTEAQGTLIPAATLLGYVAENAATNLCLQSQTFDNAGWVKEQATITANTVTAPDGTLTGDTFTDDAVNAKHDIYGSVTVTNGQPYTFSLYVKQGTLPWVRLATGASATLWANFNLATGAVGNKTAGVTATVQTLPNGWFRCSVSITADGALIYHQILSSNSDSSAVPPGPAYIGTGQTMYLWGAQVEASSDPSSYIPTTTAAVVRNLDFLTYPQATNLDVALATVYSEIYTLAAAPGLNQMVVTFSTTSPQFIGGVRVMSVFTSAGAISTANTRTVGAVNKGAIAYSGSTASLCLNGGVVATGAFLPFGASAINIGGRNANEALQGTVRNVKFYATRLTDVEIQGLTA